MLRALLEPQHELWPGGYYWRILSLADRDFVNIISKLAADQVKQTDLIRGLNQAIDSSFV